MTMVEVFFDGGFSISKNELTYAITSYVNGDIHDQKAFKITKAGLTSNIAEYYGIITAIQWILNNYNNYPVDTKYNVKGDSLLIISQVQGTYKTKNTNLLPLNQLAQSLLRCHPLNGLNITLQWVERQFNDACDSACRKI